MRTETDKFIQHDEEDFYCRAYICGGNISIASVDAWDSIHISLTKQQAAEFARQILEMCEQ